MATVKRESMNFKLPQPIACALRKAASPQPGKTATDIVIVRLVLARSLQKLEGYELGRFAGELPKSVTVSRMWVKVPPVQDAMTPYLPTPSGNNRTRRVKLGTGRNQLKNKQVTTLALMGMKYG